MAVTTKSVAFVNYDFPIWRRHDRKTVWNKDDAVILNQSTYQRLLIATYNEFHETPFKPLNQTKDSIELNCIELNSEANQHIKDC